MADGASYYDREVTTFLDGSPVFATEKDRRNEESTARVLERAWRCELRRYGELSPVDWFAVRDGRIVGVLELKSRSHESTRYPTVFLNQRKQLSLVWAAMGTGAPALFVVRFTDGIWWTIVGLAMGDIKLGGCREIVKARSDIEPVIHVPVAEMRQLPQPGQDVV